VLKMAKIQIDDNWDNDDFDADKYGGKEERFTSRNNKKQESKASAPKKEQPTFANTFATPVAGDIVLAYFPERQNPYEPGPKARPSLVLAVTEDDNGNAILHMVAGTSKKLDFLRPHEFIIKGSDMPFDETTSGLKVNTKFDMARLVQVPYNDKWLLGRMSSSITVNAISPILGKINMEERKNICLILDKVKSQLIVQDNATPKIKSKKCLKP
jgi:hypothetical protein